MHKKIRKGNILIKYNKNKYKGYVFEHDDIKIEIYEYINLRLHK